MSLGYDKEQNIVNLGDTAKLVATLYDDEDKPFSADDLVSVSYQVASPDNTRVTVVGLIEDDGTGQARFADTMQVGQYIAVATFLTADGDLQSTRVDFEVVDPFEDATPSSEYIAAIATWAKLEDCFDTENDGPWLRDVTNSWFNKDKMDHFLSEALFLINNQNPPTTLSIGDFVNTGGATPAATADLPLLSQGMLVRVIQHLIRSYVEQPNPVGGQVAWQDRRDYMQRWQSVLTIEQAQFDKMLALYKRRFLHLGESKLLISSKAGRLIPAPMRTRMIGRGYW